MKIEFTREDAEKILYESFCSGGITEMQSSNVIIDWESKLNSTNYNNAKKRLKERKEHSFCLEDVYIEILKNGDVIQFEDCESEEFINLHIEDAVVNFNSLNNEEKLQLAKLLDEDDCSTDAFDCFNAIQYALYGEVIFG
jgi:hypothetical protein